MKQSKKQRINLWIIIVLTAAGFVVWVIFLFWFWLFLRLIGVSTDLWAMIEALSTAVAAAAVLSAGFIAYRELKAQDISQYMDVADRLYDELNSAENIAARRWIFRNLPENPADGVAELSDDGRNMIKTVLNSLDRVAFLTRDGWIPDEMVMPWINPMVVKSWTKLEAYVDFESKRRHEPDYYGEVRELATACLSWREKNLPAAKITWVDDAL